MWDEEEEPSVCGVSLQGVCALRALTVVDKYAINLHITTVL